MEESAFNILWIVGALSCILSIWQLKRSRYEGEKALRMWQLLIILLSTLVPIWNISVGLTVLITVYIGYGADEDFCFQAPKSWVSFLEKLKRFLSRKL